MPRRNRALNRTQRRGVDSSELEKPLRALPPLLGGPVEPHVPAPPPGVLGQLIGDLGPEIAERLLLTARASLAQSGATLQAALAAGEAAPIAAAAHKLAGLASSARLEALRSMAETLEAAARDGLNGTLSALDVDLPAILADADASLAQALDRIRAAV